eukprot:8535990-Karenia_brevis.AAC.1
MENNDHSSPIWAAVPTCYTSSTTRHCQHCIFLKSSALHVQGQASSGRHRDAKFVLQGGSA